MSPLQIYRGIKSSRGRGGSDVQLVKAERGEENTKFQVEIHLRPMKIHEERAPGLLFKGVEGRKWGPAGRSNG